MYKLYFIINIFTVSFTVHFNLVNFWKFDMQQSNTKKYIKLKNKVHKHTHKWIHRGCLVCILSCPVSSLKILESRNVYSQLAHIGTRNLKPTRGITSYRPAGNFFFHHHLLHHHHLHLAGGVLNLLWSAPTNSLVQLSWTSICDVKLQY